MTVIVSIHRALTHRSREILRIIAMLGAGRADGPRSLRQRRSAFWAFWGAAETFHEGWYYRELWGNVGLSIVQYFPAMLISMGAGLLNRSALALCAWLLPSPSRG